MKTAVIGASGLIGSRLIRRFRQEFPDALGTSCRTSAADLTPFDLRTPDLSRLGLVESGHQAAVIAAATSDLAVCEHDPRAAEVNVRGTLELLRQLGRMGLHAIFLSSDQVFGGRTGGYSEHSPPEPRSAYGRQKRQVEEAIVTLCPRHTVIRLSKTFSVERHGGGLLNEMAAALLAGDSIDAADDLIFSPTRVDDVASAIAAISRRQLTGVVHVANQEACSRHRLAVALARALDVDTRAVRRVAYADLGLGVQRPLNTSLLCHRLRDELPEIRFTSVEQCLRLVAASWRRVR